MLRVSDLDILAAREIAFTGSLAQHLPSTWQIAALYAFLAIVRNDNINLCVSLGSPRSEGGSKLSRWGRPLQGKTTGVYRSSSRSAGRNLVVEREVGAKLEREERKRCQTRKSPLVGTSERLLIGGANSVLL